MKIENIFWASFLVSNRLLSPSIKTYYLSHVLSRISRGETSISVAISCSRVNIVRLTAPLKDLSGLSRRAFQLACRVFSPVRTQLETCFCRRGTCSFNSRHNVVFRRAIITSQREKVARTVAHPISKSNKSYRKTALIFGIIIYICKLIVAIPSLKRKKFFVLRTVFRAIRAILF